MSTNKPRPIIGRIGGKVRIAPWITTHLKESQWSTYIEPFCGSAAVYFQLLKEGVFDQIALRNEQPRIVLNDLDRNIINLFKTCRDYPEALAEAVNLTPYSRQEHRQAKQGRPANLEDARQYLVSNWQSRNGGDTSRSNQWSVSLYPERCEFRERLGRWNDLPNRILAASPHFQGGSTFHPYDCLNETGRAFLNIPDPKILENSRQYLISNWQSQSADGGWSFETHGARSRQTQWNTIPHRLLNSVAALKKCYIENDDAIACMERWQSPHSCFYIDPPYVDLEAYYAESKDEDIEFHRRLAECAQTIEASCIAISYYPHPLLDELYPADQWQRFYKDTVASSVGLGKNATTKKRPKRQEMLLIRRDCQKQSIKTQLSLFE